MQNLEQFYLEALRLDLGTMISPRMAIVHVTNRCQHSCTDCEYSALHSPDAQEIEGERLMTLIDEIADLGSVSILFSGGGEPTLHPMLGDALKKTSGRKLSCGLFTNGGIIDSKLADSIVENCAFVRFSIDAAHPETYAQIRGITPASFWKLLETVESIIEIRKRAHSQVEIGLKFLIRTNNLGEIPEFITLAEKLGVQNVQFKPLRNAPGVLNKDDSEQARKMIEKAKKKKGHTVRIQGGIADIKVSTPCWISPLRVVISAEGDVHLCNYFNHRRDTHTFGNIYRKELKELWGSEAHRDALDMISSGECALYDCRFHHLNEMLKSLIKKRAGFDFV